MRALPRPGFPMEYPKRSSVSVDSFFVPAKDSLIEVYWVLDNIPGAPKEWCIAKVLHISEESSSDLSLAKGAILYPASDHWEEQVSEVQFLPDRLLRCALKDEEGQACDALSSENDNPSMSWRYAAYKGDGNRISLGNPMKHTEDSSDEEWDPILQNGPTGKKSFSKGKRAVPRADTRNCGDTEFKRLRVGQSQLRLDLERWRVVIESQSRRLTQLELSRRGGEKRCTLPECVLGLLKRKLAMKFQSRLKPFKLASLNVQSRKKRWSKPWEDTETTQIVDGVYRSSLRSRVACTLQKFEMIAWHIRVTVPPELVGFFPDFDLMQSPPLCIEMFVAAFASFPAFCDGIGIHSTADRLQMIRKCGDAPTGELLRLLGTYAYEETDDGKPCFIFVGTSCGPTFDNAMSSVFHGADANTSKYPVLVRRSPEWNQVDTRFSYPLKLYQGCLPAVVEPTSEHHAFSVTWKRSPEPGSRFWSEDICNSKTIFGSLEVCPPCVQISGTHLCSELGILLATDDLLEKLVSSKHNMAQCEGGTPSGTERSHV